MLDPFVKLTKVTDPMNLSILFWYDESGRCLFTFFLRYEHSECNKMVEFFFESGQVNARQGVRPCMYRLGIGV